MAGVLVLLLSCGTEGYADVHAVPSGVPGTLAAPVCEVLRRVRLQPDLEGSGRLIGADRVAHSVRLKPDATSKDSQPAAVSAESEPLPVFPLVSAWSVSLDASPVAPPVFDRESAYFALETGDLVAVSIPHGSIRFRVKQPTKRSVAADGGRLFAAAERMLVAIDHRAGAPLWQVPLPDDASAAPTAKAGWVVVPLESGELLAFRGPDGQRVWTAALGAPVRLTPLINGDRVLVVAGLSVKALDVTTGKTVWDRTLNGETTSIALGPERIFAGTNARWLFALDERSGAVKWKWRIGGDVIGMATDEDVVYVLMLDSTIRAFKMGSGAQQWREPLPYRPYGGPVRVNETLLVVGLAPTIRSYATKDGAPGPAFQVPLPEATPGAAALEALAGPPHFHAGASFTDDLLVVYTQRGNVNAARRQLAPAPQPLTVLPGAPITLPGLPGEAAGSAPR
jgi:outer membrane protein assembly factor BamB